MTTIGDLESILEKFKQGTLETKTDKMQFPQGKPILLYGAGNIGKRLYKNLIDTNIQVVCFIDRNSNLGTTLYDVPIYQPESKQLEAYKKNGYIILSGLFSLNICNEIKNHLYSLGFKNVLALHEINLCHVNSQAFYENLFDSKSDKLDVIEKDSKKIVEAFKLLSDEKDKKLYIDYIRAHLTMDFTQFEIPFDVNLQYLGHDIEYEKDYTNFVDCGGFDGDTLKNLVKKEKQMSNIAIFEPQNTLCEKISEYTKEKQDLFNSVTIFPCGVHSKTQKLKFSVSKDAPSSAKLSNTGEDIIQCVAIDEVLQGFKPTFIKMDIEGAEIEALKGAQVTIQKYHPQLAICVYHSLSDIWEIPLLINSFYKDYVFYLRSYNYMGLETVLYAFPRK